jgi:hypothetical protein
MTLRRNVVGLTLLLALVTKTTPVSGEDSASSVATPHGPPVLQEYRYRLSGGIRPLLFWIGDSDVGAARIIRRGDGNSRLDYELLIGSDPSRVPRGINRWGWVREEQREDGATQMGLMRKIDEQSLEEARARAGLEGEYVFKVIRTEIADGRARAENTVWLVPDDYTYYDLEKLLRLVEEAPQTPPKVNEGPLPPGTHPGLLFAVADLVDRAVAAATQNPRELLKDVTTHFNFNAVVCDMRLRKTEWEESKEYGDRRYERLVRMEFESYDPQLRVTQQFTLVCGTEGKWKSVPVYIKFQPKWWFKTEGVIDESQVFERPQEHTRRSEPGAPEGAH